jgi:hypothetical protein
MYFYILLISFNFYSDLMMQVISGKWYARVLVTLSLTCLRVLVPIVGQHPSDLVRPLMRLHNRHHRLHHP